MSARLTVCASVVCALVLFQGCAATDPSTTVDSSIPTSSTVTPSSVPMSVEPTTRRPLPPPVMSRLDPTPACIGEEQRRSVGARGVRVVTPTSRERVPLLVVIHGYKESPDRLSSFSELDSLPGEGLAMVAYPEGTPLDLGFGWNSGARRFATRSVDDVDLLGEVIDDLVASGCADSTAVYLVGESNGGGMALHAACDERMAGRLAGIVLVNPAVDEGVLRPCVGRVPALTLLAAVGTLDRVIPVDGSREPFLGVGEWFPRAARTLATCSQLQEGRLVLSDAVTVVRGLDCARCVELYESADGGHTWPGSTTALNGAPIGSFELNERIVAMLVARRTSCARD